jgi:glutamate-1-semialdehyde 2,1-aminomutase
MHTSSVGIEPSAVTGPDAASDWAARALAAFPAGSNGEFDLPAELTCVIREGSGCRIRDGAGRAMLDFSMGWGSVLPGHGHPDIVQAVQSRVALGTNFATVNTESLQLAEELLRIQPPCDQGHRVRFCASGTEATMHCLRLARAFTGRTLVLKFEGAYHGSNDEGVTSLFPSGRTPFPQPEPSSAGVRPEATIVAPFNDAQAAAGVIAAHAASLAAVIVEPMHRCLAPAPGFLASIRTSCDRFGVPLIFDEVVTGFRLAYGGAQERYGVRADLVAYGKALGGGLPIGAYVGRRDILELTEEHLAGRPGYVWSASTLGGNPLSCAAANAALRLYSAPETYRRLDAAGLEFRELLRRALRDTGHVGQVIGEGPLGQIVFSDRPVTDYRSTIAGNRAKSRAMMLGLFRAGVFVNPMGTKIYLSLAHDVDSFEDFEARLVHVLMHLRQ